MNKPTYKKNLKTKYNFVINFSHVCLKPGLPGTDMIYFITYTPNIYEMPLGLTLKGLLLF